MGAELPEFGMVALCIAVGCAEVLRCSSTYTSPRRPRPRRRFGGSRFLSAHCSCSLPSSSSSPASPPVACKRSEYFTAWTGRIGSGFSNFG